jgi:imidazolonepropionase-like amidohydrolase
MTGGHGCLVGQEVDGPIEARKYARLNLKMGADNIKMVASGGIMTPNADPRAPSLTVEELAAGFDEARKAGKLSACHAHSLEGVKNALRAGVRTIEHGVWLDEEACDMLRENEAYLCPTLSVLDNLVRHAEDPGTLPHVRARAAMVAEATRESFKLARAMGVKIICGTDAGMPHTRHGETWHELALMVQCGVSAEEALRMGTSGSAEAMGLFASHGSVELGKAADLLVTDADPLADITALSSPAFVFKGGHCVRDPRGRLRSSNEH